MLIVLCSSVTFAKDEDPFALGVRNTEPLAPLDELKKLHAPPGFEIQLVASEPDINKPMNLAFDDKGRMWVTSTVEYPFAAKDRAGRDSIKILEDVDDNGRARKITTFADKLNIPIGIYPWKGGAIAFDIPKIAHYIDDDGDGKYDRVVPLYAEFGQNDTHGITNSFRRDFDGWLYANHGFNNKSVVKASDGSQIDLFSGSTYRMAIDGSHIEQFTWGQTNPFGMSIDPFGNHYNADSHSKPIYQLLRGGYYEGLGKHDDGLGFAPMTMKHLHGSTAIAGSCFYAAEQFSEEFRGNVFVGNVITSRVNRDKLTYHGSSPVATEMPDFITSEDPWFRPNDIQLGPDGAMYITDFYNRIIGHYEVPLTHPQRDHERGRIWRVVYVGEGAKKLPPRFDFSAATLPVLLEKLGDANLKVRMMATDEIVDRIGKGAIEPARELTGNPWQRAHRLWILKRLGAMDSDLLAQAAKDKDAIVRVHAMRVAAETKDWDPRYHAIAIAGLADSNPLAVRCAADALGRHPDVANVRLLLHVRENAPSEDTHLMYVVRMSLRDQLRAPENFAKLPADLSDSNLNAIADVALSIETMDSGSFFAKNLARLGTDNQKLSRYLKHASRFASGELESLAALVRERFADDIDTQMELFKSMLEGTAQRNATLGEAGRAWGTQLAERAFAEAETGEWITSPLPDTPQTANPFNIEKRASGDGDKASKFFSTLPGEQLTGVLRSPAFSIPSKLDFFMAGHDGSPNSPAQGKNLIRLQVSGTDEIVAQSPPPRNDLAQPISWDLQQYEGKQGYLEIIDGDDGGGYAWLAVGRLQPAVVKIPSLSPAKAELRQQTAAEIAGALKLPSVKDQLKKLVITENTFAEARGAAATALAVIDPDNSAAALEPILVNPAAPALLREKVAAALGSANAPTSRQALVNAINVVPARLQMTIGLALTENTAGAEMLLDAMSKGKAPPRLLLEPKIKERLTAANVKDLDVRLADLTKGLPSRNEVLEKLIETKKKSFAKTPGNAAKGQKIFATNCVACHSVAGQGGVLGPQLDGIGARGSDRVIEDILDPNRNVDPAFRYSIITKKDNDIVTGLQRRQEGEKIVFADSLGKEFSIDQAQIKKRVESRSSLMPTNFGEIIPAGDFNDLLAFLISKRPGGKNGPTTTVSK